MRSGRLLPGGHVGGHQPRFIWVMGRSIANFTVRRHCYDRLQVNGNAAS